MKKIKFQKLSIEGFGSIAVPLVLDLSKSGITQVIGKNGAGKTTLFNALVWALYGRNLKNDVQDLLVTNKKVRPKEYKGTRVAVQLYDGTTTWGIVRHRQYKSNTFGVDATSASLMLFREGDYMTDFVDVQSAQQFVTNSILKVPEDVFISTFFFAQRSVRFMERKASEKRELFDMLLDLSFVDNFLSFAVEKKALLKQEHASYSSKWSSHEIELRRVTAQIEEYSRVLAEFKDSHDLKISNAKGNLSKSIVVAEEKSREYKGYNALFASSREALERMNEAKQAFTLSESTKNSAEEKKGELSSRLIGAQKEHAELLAKNQGDMSGSVSCDACGQPVREDNSKYVAYMKEHISKVAKDIDATQNELSYTTQDLKELEKTYAAAVANLDGLLAKGDVGKDVSEFRLNTLKQEFDKATADVKYNEATLAVIAKEEPPKLDIKALQKEKDIHTKASVEQSVAINIVEVEIDLYNKVLASLHGGKLKIHIINAMLVELNKELLAYAELLGVFIDIYIDTSKTSLPFVVSCKQMDGLVIPYQSLSGRREGTHRCMYGASSLQYLFEAYVCF